MRLLILVLTLVGICKNLTAQNNVSLRASQIHLEIFGPGSLWSINLDRRFLKSENGLGYKIGLGGSPIGIFGESCNRGALITLPAGINYIAGKNNHKIEIGGGGVLAIVGATKVYCMNIDTDFFSEGTSPYAYLSAGYRYQPVGKKGVTYRLFFSPLFQKNFNPKLWGGAGIGYRW